ncbi:phosphotyrosine protein phosphatase [Actinoplanes sp. NPDC051346]|uniref:arsenate reductase/protein-tyrosine-phosphatase family protein n=1 Tax=Actinoplanes sp. NPDC051346 TaxID=3155048 RepID=UPI003437F202
MPPFTVLHVCLGNICRSPMAEHLLRLVVGRRLANLDPGADPGELLRSVSAGTGGWHEGEEMNPPASRQIALRGGVVAGFTARKLTGEHLAEAGLVLTATAEQSDYVVSLAPGVACRTFVLGQFARLLRELDLAELPPAGTDPRTFTARATALVAAADRRRAHEEPLPGDDLDDPWGRGDQTFQRIAETIDESLYALVDALLPGAPRPA